MHKTNALYLKTQRLIAETNRDTHTKRYTETQRHTDIHTQRHTHRHTKTHRHRHIETHTKCSFKGFPSFCYTHESLQIIVA